MRCDNCGWDNADNVTRCIKCNTKLETAKAGPVQQQPNKNQFASTIADNVLFKNTSGENDKINHAFAATQMEQKEIQTQTNDDELVPCPNPECGYLNAKMAKVCPKCKTPLQQVATPLTSDESAEKMNNINSTAQVQYAVDPLAKGTIDPYRKLNTLKPACVFEIVKKEGESINDDFLSKKFEFDNDAIVLNRLNLDEKNNSITGKVQAELSYENGKWYLTDKSELKTTFVQALDKTELKNGDLILMGDRKFIFMQDTK